MAYDEEFKPKASKRLVYSHDFEYINDDTDLPDYDDYDIDVNISDIQANVHNRTPRTRHAGRPPRKEQPQRARMPFDRGRN